MFALSDVQKLTAADRPKGMEILLGMDRSLEKGKVFLPEVKEECDQWIFFDLENAKFLTSHVICV